MDMDRNFDIFISYRRNGGYDVAKHLYDLLNFDGYKVSFDIDTLRNGDFDTQLLNRIDECKDFIIILNPGALDRSTEQNSDKSNDWVREELSYALSKGKNIIPIMLPGFTFPDNLPPDIKNVEKKNGPSYSREYFDEFYTRLKKKFLQSVPTKRTESFYAPIEATIRINADKDCKVYLFNEHICNYSKGDFLPIKLKKGKHILRFKSSDSEIIEKEYTVEDVNFEDIIKIRFKHILTSGISALAKLNNGDFLYFYRDKMTTLHHDRCPFLNRKTHSLDDISNFLTQSDNFTEIGFEDFVTKYVNNNSQCLASYDIFNDYCRIKTMGLRSFESMSASLFYLSAQLNPEKQYYTLLRYVESGKQPRDLYMETGDGIYEVKGPEIDSKFNYLKRKNFIIKDDHTFSKTILGGLLILQGITEGYFHSYLLLTSFPYEISLHVNYKNVITMLPWTTIPYLTHENVEIKDSDDLCVFINQTFYKLPISNKFSLPIKRAELELEIDSWENISVVIKDLNTSVTQSLNPFLENLNQEKVFIIEVR